MATTESSPLQSSIKSVTPPIDSSTHIYALINYKDTYVQPLLLIALQKCLPRSSYTLIKSQSELPSQAVNYLHIGTYEDLPFEYIMSHVTTSLTNAYIIRKALIRKHYLSTTAHNWITKYPTSILQTNIKVSCEFELDYPEFLDDAIVEAWELQQSFKNNVGKNAADREWWILKPGMSDRGHGIRLFSTQAELQAIFEEWEALRSDSDDELGNDELCPNTSSNFNHEDRNKLITSDLRHFVAQLYISQPFLLRENPRKFHIRTYVLAIGGLKVYVYHEMLALFSPLKYTPPWDDLSSGDISAHLTNTCLQTGNHDGSVQLLTTLDLPAALKTSIYDQIDHISGEIFEAAARGMLVHFQTLPNVFEVFGLDFLVDEAGTTWLLEVNAFPDFQQTGHELQEVVSGLWEAVVATAVVGFFGITPNSFCKLAREKMRLVKDIKLRG
ncbi:tubulin-tyrosine ligase family protein [Blumeria hordei DH14]|uniref:Tubulin-tyrosine ligase family protein n=1 Tax=Blumeria graminis f. sp. hordei (strain DH14) TaxID=546991 RepID=N1JMV6_BLUG1|nr:tubulin-tyrosine ligase family protein [Blumeria hordei DH14]